MCNGISRDCCCLVWSNLREKLPLFLLPSHEFSFFFFGSSHGRAIKFLSSYTFGKKRSSYNPRALYEEGRKKEICQLCSTFVSNKGVCAISLHSDSAFAEHLNMCFLYGFIAVPVLALKKPHQMNCEKKEKSWHGRK